MRKLGVVFGVMLLFSLGAAAYLVSKRTSPDLPQMGEIYDFHLTDQDAQVRSLKDFKGQPWIVSFLFTRCDGPCPILASKISSLSKNLTDLPAVKMVSISMDPDYDQPSILKEFGTKYEADFSRWTFLTGPMQDIIKLSKEAFKVPAGENPSMHTTRVVLIDQAGQIRGYYDGLDATAMQKLLVDVRGLMQHPAV